MEKDNTTVNRVRVALLSDLHFFTKTKGIDTNPSWLEIEGTGIKNINNPWTSLEKLIEEKAINADLLLCPGDITTYAQEPALSFAWEKLNKLREKLNAKLLAASTGNHDVDSRGHKIESEKVIAELNNPSDMLGPLRRLKPFYPISFSEASKEEDAVRGYRTKYFGDNFVLLNEEDFRLIVLDTCACHTTIASDHERGYVSFEAIEEIKRQLDKDKSRKINLMLCHHHPIQHQNHKLGSYDFLLNGQTLTDELSKHGDWIIFHGHKHHARLAYAQGGNTSPVVFAAASFSAQLNGSMSQISRNQFYIIDIELKKIGSPLGNVKAWTWYVGSPWTESCESDVGLPSGCGFGNRRHPDEIARDIDQIMTGQSMDWGQMVLKMPELKNITPGDLGLVENSLKNFSIETERESEGGEIRSIGKVHP